MRKPWKTAREKERRQARFCIRERVASVGCDAHSPPSDHSNSNIAAAAGGGDENDREADVHPTAGHLPTTNHLDLMPDNKAKNEVTLILGKVNGCDRSFFSVILLADRFDLLSTPILTDILLERLPVERILSCFGSDYLELVQTIYLKSFLTLSLMEYSVLIGRYHILSALLLGGISPCLRGRPHGPISEAHSKVEQGLQTISSRVLQRFFDFFPLSLSSYVVKRVVDMRLQAFAGGNNSNGCEHLQPLFTCQLCQKDIPSSYCLKFTSFNKDREDSCGCTFCEVCFWKDMLQHIDSRVGEDVVLCPCCAGAQAQPNGKRGAVLTKNTVGPLSPHERGQESKQKFDSLPLDSKALKKSKLKKKKVSESDSLAESWSKAVIPSLGLCQSVRIDKLFTYTERGTVPYVKGCLELGVDVNARNDYGQTPLYIAVWNGSSALVELLLTNGANPWVKANGNLTLDGICNVYGHTGIHGRLQYFRREHWRTTSQPKVEPNPILTGLDALQFHLNYNEPTLEVLIDVQRDHPGAGSFLITNCIQAVKPLVELWGCLPVDQMSPKTAKKHGACADRSYFCDAEGVLRKMLKNPIVEAFRRDGAVAAEDSNIIVLPHVRFLHYSRAGSFLAPHVDLCRLDQASGQRSTHSFLLYLTTCENGGETALLGDLSGEEVLSQVKPRAGNLLLFPANSPHQGNVVEDVPKLLIRGEVVLKVQAKNE